MLQPTLLDCVINATIRLRVSQTNAASEDKVSYGTRFCVSPCMVFTTGHILDKDLVNEVKLCQGIVVNANGFDATVALKGDDAKVFRSHSKAKDTNILSTRGEDIACFKCEGDFESLLPCSPSFVAADTKIAVLSFPLVDRFLKNAEKELCKGECNDTGIWEQYFLAVKPIYEERFKQYAKENEVRVSKAKATKSIIKEVSKKVKLELFEELQGTFGVAHIGSMLCSVGNIMCLNKAALGTSCSTLAGSPGAVVIPLSRPRDFIEIQRGGCKGYDLNSTTSCDNKDFVDMYMSEVLHTLPALESRPWRKRDIEGFKHWLTCHKSAIPEGSVGCEAYIFRKPRKRKALLQ